METRIFVSYAREDLVAAKAVVDFLKVAGFRTWFDQDNLLPGENWRQVIEKEIGDAQLLLICISKNSVDKTGFVQKEMRIALEQAELRPPSRMYIVPLSLDGTRVPRDLQQWHILNLRDKDAPAKLLAAIQKGTREGARAPKLDHQKLAETIQDYNSTALGRSAKDLLAQMEQEPDPEMRGIVEILIKPNPGQTAYFPSLQYAGNPSSMKSRLFSEGVEELVTAGRLYPPESNPSRNARTYEYRQE